MMTGATLRALCVQLTTTVLLFLITEIPPCCLEAFYSGEGGGGLPTLFRRLPLILYH